jgi:hypothetical protein
VPDEALADQCIRHYYLFSAIDEGGVIRQLRCLHKVVFPGKNEGKTIQKLIFSHARQLWLQMVANGCKWHEEGNADPVLS